VCVCVSVRVCVCVFVCVFVCVCVCVCRMMIPSETAFKVCVSANSVCLHSSYFVNSMCCTLQRTSSVLQCDAVCDDMSSRLVQIVCYTNRILHNLYSTLSMSRTLCVNISQVCKGP